MYIILLPIQLSFSFKSLIFKDFFEEGRKKLFIDLRRILKYITGENMRRESFSFEKLNIMKSIIKKELCF